MKWKNMAMAGALALASVSFAGVPSPAMADTHLSQCMRNGLIGAGVGAAVGGLLVGGHHHARNAVLGAAVGGVGTYAICRALTRSDQSRIERNYRTALRTNHSVTDAWQSNGSTRTLYVSRPVSAEDAGYGCRTVQATLRDPQQGRQELPPETYCRNSDGQWIPA